MRYIESLYVWLMWLLVSLAVRGAGVLFIDILEEVL